MCFKQVLNSSFEGFEGFDDEEWNNIIVNMEKEMCGYKANISYVWEIATGIY